MSPEQRASELTLAELLVAAPVTAAAGVIATTYLLDVVGWRFNWGLIALAALGGMLLTAGLASRFGVRWRCRADWPSTLGLLAVMAGLGAYLVWLSGADLLPPTESSDLVHHLNLIKFLQLRQTLVHDPALAEYLVEFVIHPAGSHSLSALAATVFGTTGLKVIYPVVMAAVVLKSGFVYLIVLRVLPAERRHPAVALAAPAALLLSWNYFFVPFAAHFYYGQLLGEMFVIGLLWLTVRFNDQPAAIWLAWFSWLGAGAALCWTAWLPIPVFTLLVIIWAGHRATIRRRVLWSVTALGATGLLLGVYVFGYLLRNDLSIFLYEGSTVRPTLDGFGSLLVIAGLAGLIVSARNAAAHPIRVFAVSAVAQFVGLFLAALAGRVSFYLGLKILHILIYPLAIFTALAVEAGWHWPLSRLHDSWRRRYRRTAVMAPLVILTVAVGSALPSAPPASAVNSSALEAGEWAKAHLPNDCIDYVVDHWVTAYWLHVVELGNPIISPHTEMIVSDWQYAAHARTRWSRSPGLPYAVVANLEQADISAPIDVLARFGPAAVVARRGNSQCEFSSASFEQVLLDTKP